MAPPDRDYPTSQFVMLHLLAATVKSAQAKVIAGNNPRISLTIIFWGGVDGEEEELYGWTVSLAIHYYIF